MVFSNLFGLVINNSQIFIVYFMYVLLVLNKYLKSQCFEVVLIRQFQAENIWNIKDAFENYFTKESIEGFTSSKTNSKVSWNLESVYIYIYLYFIFVYI